MDDFLELFFTSESVKRSIYSRRKNLRLNLILCRDVVSLKFSKDVLLRLRREERFLEKLEEELDVPSFSY